MKPYTHIEFRGADLLVEYTEDGQRMSATETDPAEYPACIIDTIYIDGIDITDLLRERHEDIALKIERSWREE